MSEGQRPTLLAYLRRLTGGPAVEGSDAQLLDRFVAQRDEDAFASLMRRHGPMVWGVCRRVLAVEQSAEDAFQATFLVLFRKAGAVSKRASLRSWLYGVALRIALRARQSAELRRLREHNSPPRPVENAQTESVWTDVRPILDEEIQRLPEKYRLPIVLCYLEGQTNDEAARILNCPRGTIATRLARGRERLRARLIRRGLTLSMATLAAMLSENALSATVPPMLAAATAKAALSGSIPTSIIALSEGALRTMFVSKLKTILASLLIFTTIGSAGVCAFYLGAEAQPKPENPSEEKDKTGPRKIIADLNSDARMLKLLKERHEKAKQEVEVRYQKFRAGVQDATLDLVLASYKRLRKTELELSRNKADRLTAHEEHVKRTKEISEICKRKHEVGRMSLADFAQAVYERLDAEIELEREKAR